MRRRLFRGIPLVARSCDRPGAPGWYHRALGWYLDLMMGFVLVDLYVIGRFILENI